MKKIVTADSLAKMLNKNRSKKIKVVFTNGVFDILHAGHVQYLQKARSLGDLLVVGINTDASVRRLKGPTRPINKLSDRMTVLAALGCVDYVVSFSTQTPLTLIKKIMPDILVKGADYTVDNIVGAKEVLAAGGSVKTITLLKGRSTTSIIERMKK